MRGYDRLLDVSPGFQLDGIASFGVVLPQARYPDRFAEAALYDRVLERLRALPGVESAAAITCPPLTCHLGNFMQAEGQAVPRPDEPNPVTLVRVATGDYFRSVGTPLVHGRFYSDAEGDTVGNRPIVVNESFARRFWPGEANPVGRRVKFQGDAADQWFTIVGVTRDERHYGLHEPPRPGIYVSMRSWIGISSTSSMRFVARTRGDPEALFAGMRRVVAELDPELPVYQVQTMRQALDRSLAPRRLVVTALALFGAIALVLAVTGVYAVVSYVVGRRRHELGIRVALGAQRGRCCGSWWVMAFGWCSSASLWECRRRWGRRGCFRACSRAFRSGTSRPMRAPSCC